VVVFAILELVADTTRRPDGQFSMIGRISLALAFTVVMRFAWQFQLYMRTDLYYVFATALNCHDLHDAGTALLRNRLWRLLGRTSRLVDEQQWTEHDRRVGRWYGPFILLGVTIMLLIAVLGSLPVVVQYFQTAAVGIRQGPLRPAFWDGVLGLVFLAILFVLPAYLAWRKRRSPVAASAEEVS
jgi:prepilin signal peptidase PulO-like enzyme (type II secretory pathway)